MPCTNFTYIWLIWYGTELMRLLNSLYFPSFLSLFPSLFLCPLLFNEGSSPFWGSRITLRIFRNQPTLSAKKCKITPNFAYNFRRLIDGLKYNLWIPWVKDLWFWNLRLEYELLDIFLSFWVFIKCKNLLIIPAYLPSETMLKMLILPLTSSQHTHTQTHTRKQTYTNTLHESETQFIGYL